MTKKRKPKSSKPKKPSQPKQPKPKRIALWRQMAISEGVQTKEEQLRWKAQAVALYKASKEQATAKEKTIRHKLGYALGIRHDKPREPEQPKENLLKQYKRYVTEKNAISVRGVGYQNFLHAIEQLPTELQVYLTDEIHRLEKKWGEDAVARYLDTFNLLEDNLWSETRNPYLSILAESYVLRLGAALEIASDGAADEDYFEARVMEIQKDIDALSKNTKYSSRHKLQSGLSVDVAAGESLTAHLKEFFDEETEDFYK